MKDRLLEFLKAENKTSAQLAEEIGVQPSGISHILSGRNNPSLDFVLKMLEKYQFLSTDWLLFGKGIMYKDIRMQSLFEEDAILNRDINIKVPPVEDESKKIDNKSDMYDQSERNTAKSADVTRRSFVSRIVMFYDDNSFEDYSPR